MICIVLTHVFIISTCCFDTGQGTGIYPNPNTIPSLHPPFLREKGSTVGA